MHTTEKSGSLHTNTDDDSDKTQVKDSIPFSPQVQADRDHET